MKPFNSDYREEGVSSLIEYLQISGILILFIIIILLSIYPVFIENPLYTLTHHSYIDIGNGVSTRIVDLYIISPYVQNKDGLVVTNFDIPDDIAGRGYFVDIKPSEGKVGEDKIVVSGDILEIDVSIPGIGSTLGLKGTTSSTGVNNICYNSTGGGCPW